MKVRGINICSILLLLSTHRLVSCEKVIVSAEHGKDTVRCGSTMTPCKSLHYAISNIAKTNDVIALDPGKGNIVYAIEQNINITKDVQITNFGRNRYQPIINFHSASLVFNSVKDFHVTFSAVTFEKLASITHITHGHLTLNNCTVRGQFILKNGVDVTDFPFIINVRNCTLSDTKVFITTKNAIVFLKDAIFTRSDFSVVQAKQLLVTKTRFLQSDLFLLDVVNMVISNSTFSGGRLMTVSVAHNTSIDVTLTRCVFNEIDIKFISENGNNTIISESIFDSNPKIIIGFCKNLLISKCSFQKGSNLLLENMNQVVIRNCTYRENLVSQTGGAISCTKTKLVVEKSLFVNNSAGYFGGTIFADEASTIHLKDVIIYGPKKAPKVPYVGTLIYVRNTLIIENAIMHPMTPGTNPVIFFSNPKADPFVFFKENYEIVCPAGHRIMSIGTIFDDDEKKKFRRQYMTYCLPCGKGKYSLKGGSEYTHMNMSEFKTQNVKCLLCPSGGSCNNEITSNGNYWGYTAENGGVNFIPCPEKYCCQGYNPPCASYNSCANNREGKLCGNCNTGFSENLFSLDCVDINNCSYASTALYISIHTLVAFLYVFVIMYVKEVVVFFKRLLSRIWDKGCEWMKQYTMKEEEGLTQINNIPTSNEEVSSDATDEIEDSYVNVTDLGTQSYVKGNKRISGLIKIVSFFYQVESLLRVNTPGKSQFQSSLIRSAVSSIFNIRIDTGPTRYIFCPAGGITALTKAFLKVSFIFTLFFILFSLYWLYVCFRGKKKSRNVRDNRSRVFFTPAAIDSYKLIESDDDCNATNIEEESLVQEEEEEEEEINISAINDDTPIYSRLPFGLRVKCCFIRMTSLGYITISVFMLKCINCVKIGRGSNLYIDGSIECFQWWQWVMLSIVFFWVVPFCLTLYIASRLLQSCKITPNQFLFILLFPPLLFIFIVDSKIKKRKVLSLTDAMAARHFLLVLFEPFRTVTESGKRSTPTSSRKRRETTTAGKASVPTTETTRGERQKHVMWECFLIFRKLTLVTAFAFIIHPVGKLYALLTLLVVFLLNHIAVQPFYDPFLNNMETASMILLSLFAAVNLFWANNYMIRDTSQIPYFHVIGEAFLYGELSVLILPPFALFLFFAGKKCYSKFKEN